MGHRRWPDFSLAQLATEAPAHVEVIAPAFHVSLYWSLGKDRGSRGRGHGSVFLGGPGW